MDCSNYYVAYPSRILNDPGGQVSLANGVVPRPRPMSELSPSTDRSRGTMPTVDGRIAARGVADRPARHRRFYTTE